MSTAVAMLTDLLQTLPCAIRQDAILLAPPTLLPPRFERLLNHRGHMTAAVEAELGTPVAVRVLQRVRRADTYAREILLVRPDGAVVQYAVVSLDLARCPPAVHAAILGERTPLGHVLQRLPGTLRIEPVAFIRTSLSESLATRFGARPGAQAWGRLVRIHQDANCLVAGLELLAPE